MSHESSRSSRRVFLLTLAVAGPAIAQTKPAAAPAAKPAATPMVDPKDPTAAALGYVDDTAKADTKKYPKHAKEQSCANCQLFQGKAGDTSGACAIFPGKHVAAKGWCSSWVKKA